MQKDNSYKNAKNSFESYPQNEQEQYNKAFKAAIKHIITLEPRLENPMDNEEITILIQSDRKGMSGDIRDILVVRLKNGWEIGFSAKNENNAVKHSRLSDKIDFGKKWFGVGVNCSEEYLTTVGRIFGNIRTLMKESKKNGNILLWSDIPTKTEEYYIPLLDAFEKEICS
jgi:hypothetical protein